MKPAWSATVKVDLEGLGWTSSGIRADFVYALFMLGHDISELREMVDGFNISTREIEDAIRFGRYLEKKGVKRACGERLAHVCDGKKRFFTPKRKKA